MKITLSRCGDVAGWMTKPLACGKVATKQTMDVAGNAATDRHKSSAKSKDKRGQSAAGDEMADEHLAYQQVGGIRDTFAWAFTPGECPGLAAAP
ncbi:hypothetical protein HBDW_28880 [Herbaspirillum sp. DW155]|uniref:hypothetical protein n=1 Tax=Herbaspirillum sp. DW155 TaxID=3095609 RepID=UPI003091D4C6|nr:hypothetical protein HBDW_28880 [Herbaspirillum sp. DW155]